jgi:hypothetical protein
MHQVTRDSFGPLIAFLLPGFVFLWGTQPLSATITEWLTVPGIAQPTVGGFLFATLASTAVGLILSAVRWAVIDTVYHQTGISPPAWNFQNLPRTLEAFESFVDAHYRFYQFYSNMLIAVFFVYIAGLVHDGRWPWHVTAWDAMYLVLFPVLVLGSRDALRKYYRRTEALLRP